MPPARPAPRPRTPTDKRARTAKPASTAKPARTAKPAKPAPAAKHASAARHASAGALLERKPSGRGGWRPGAGRPPKGDRASAPHKARPELDARHPLHIVLRSLPALGSLRRHDMYQAIRKATIQVGERDGFRIVHASLAPDALHLLIETDGKLALARGMQAFQISAAKHVNRAFSRRRPGPRRRGPVFPDRYHADPLTTPRDARDTLVRMLNGWRGHKADRDPAETASQRSWKLDWYSSAASFPGWAEAATDPRLHQPPADHEPLRVHPPRSALLRDGWKQAGATISRTEPPPR
ncbi:MAG TPA: transposase [Kofleriaceae bacterium]